MMWLHADDQRAHEFPAGWHPVYSEPMYLHDHEVWLLVSELATIDITDADDMLDLIELLITPNHVPF